MRHPRRRRILRIAESCDSFYLKLSIYDLYQHDLILRSNKLTFYVVIIWITGRTVKIIWGIRFVRAGIILSHAVILPTTAGRTAAGGTAF